MDRFGQGSFEVDNCFWYKVPVTSKSPMTAGRTTKNGQQANTRIRDEHVLTAEEVDRVGERDVRRRILRFCGGKFPTTTMAIAGSSPASISSPFSSLSFLPAAPHRPPPLALARIGIGQGVGEL